MQIRTVVFVLTASLLVAAPAMADDTVGLVDPTTGIWYLRSEDGGTTSFYFGNPRDEPFVGDWDCDGVDTPGLYRRSDGYVYLRNSNTQGVADITFFFGNPGDRPVAGDFDGDGCDSVAIYRPSEQRFYLIDQIGKGGAGLGTASYSVMFGNPGDRPLSGDFDGDGRDEIAVQRGSVVYYLTDTGGSASLTPGNGRAVAGIWNGGAATPAYFRGGAFLVAGVSFEYGFGSHIPIAGDFGDLPGLDAEPPRYPNVGSGNRIIYANAEQRVWLINPDGSLAHTWLTSGRQGVPLPGEYAVYSKSLFTRANHDGLTMTHMVRFARSTTSGIAIGFHSLPVYPDGTPAQTIDQLGTFQSGGCVRLADEAAVTLYEWTLIGTAVFVLP